MSEQDLFNFNTPVAFNTNVHGDLAEQFSREPRDITLDLCSFY